MKKRTIAIAASSIVLLVGGTVWALKNRPDPEVQKVLELQNELFANEGNRDSENWGQIRDAMQDLKPEQREQVREQMFNRMEQRELKEIGNYFALPPDQQTAYLDKQIQEDEKRQKERESRRNQRGQGQTATGQGPGGGGGQGAGPGGGRGGRNQTPEQRSMRLNKRLDNASPAQRAQRTAYRQAMAQRRAQLGLPAGGGPGGGRPRG